MRGLCDVVEQKTRCKGVKYMNKVCYVNINGDLVEGECIGVYQYSNVIAPSLMVGGHGGGVVAYPIALVKISGKLKEVEPSSITFKK